MIVENFSPSESSSCRTFLLFLFHPEIILSLLLTMKAACYDNRDTIPRVQCEYYCRLVEKRKKKKKREIGFFFIPKTILSDTVRVLWRFFFSFHHLRDIDIARKEEEERATAARPCQGRAFKFKRTQVRSFKQSQRSSLSLLRVCIRERICMRKVFYNSFDYTLATMVFQR